MYKQLFLALMLLLMTSGCATWQSHQSTRTVTQSAYGYLYQKQDETPLLIDAGTTQLNLPLRVAVAIAPDQSSRPTEGIGRAEALTVMRNIVAAEPFVSSVVTLPYGTLNRSGGYRELERIAFMHRVDTIVLVSFEQFTRSKGSGWTLLDLTLLGSYVIPGHKYMVQTRATATALHIPSQRFLFNADTCHDSEAWATESDKDWQIHTHLQDGLREATAGLAPELRLALQEFKTLIKTDESLQVAGGTSPFFLLLLLGLIAWRLNR